jgi:hypothetical protein
VDPTVASIDARLRAQGLFRNLLALLALVPDGVIHRADLTHGRAYTAAEAQRLLIVLDAIHAARRQAAVLAGAA